MKRLLPLLLLSSAALAGEVPLVPAIIMAEDGTMAVANAQISLPGAPHIIVCFMRLPDTNHMVCLVEQGEGVVSVPVSRDGGTKT